MMRYGAGDLTTSLLWLAAVNTDGSSGIFSDEAIREKYRERLRDLRMSAERSQLTAVIEKTDRLLSTWLEGTKDMNVVIAMVNQLVGDIQQELTAHLFFRVPREERSFYEDVQLTEASMKAFPSAVAEVRDAGRCFALDQPTACVLHLMRSLEVPLFALKAALEVTPSSPNWQNVINECEREIKALKNRDDQEFYGAAAANFLYFKNAWRNHAMHGRDTYDKRSAFGIMTHVQDFIEHLAMRLGEPGAPAS